MHLDKTSEHVELRITAQKIQGTATATTLPRLLLPATDFAISRQPRANFTILIQSDRRSRLSLQGNRAQAASDSEADELQVPGRRAFAAAEQP
jgi:hypothetical protein